MSLTPDQLQRIALLARIEVSAEDLRGVTDRLNPVFGLIDQLQAVDTRQAVQQRLRADAVTEPDLRGEFQAVAPAVEQGLYLVPKVIE